MRLSTRIILIFSVLILAIVLVSANYTAETNISGADRFTADRFKNMANNDMHSLERYFDMMDLAINNLTSNEAFMAAFNQVSHFADTMPLLSEQNTMFQALYHSPLADSFYRVSIYCDNGFIMTNHLDRTDTLVSLSEESITRIASLPYLDAVRTAPSVSHLLGAHTDVSASSKKTTVFGLVRGIVYHGVLIGYIEVAAEMSELEQLLITDNATVETRVVLSNGDILYNSPADTANYTDVPLDTYTSYTDPSGLSRDVYHTASTSKDFEIYVSQDASITLSANTGLLHTYLEKFLLYGGIAMVLVVIAALGVTSSIRKLNKRIRQLPVQALVQSQHPEALNEYVTRSTDKELHALEEDFNGLLTALHATTQKELSLRESSLRSSLQALQAQINPHFVYNTLNVIAAKGMESGNEEIVEMCDSFAQMLRYSTDTRSESSTIGDDLRHTENYLTLLKARYEEQLEYTIDVPETFRRLLIPKLSLQPLVENAMAHGFEKGSEEIRRISIHGTQEVGKLILEIRDNGTGFSPDVLERLRTSIAQIESDDTQVPDNGGHIGLLNTCLRIHYYSKGAMHMEIFNDHGAVVRLVQKQN